jgi:hypothetical protein
MTEIRDKYQDEQKKIILKNQRQMKDQQLALGTNPILEMTAEHEASAMVDLSIDRTTFKF